MINNSTQIIENVPGRCLDPMLLAKSQATESTGFIMITYEISGQEVAHARERMLPERRFYDLLFLRGQTIFDCARLNQDLRFRVNVESSLLTFSRHRDEPGTMISLFQSSDEIIHRFQLTFFYEPCVNVQIDALPKEQIGMLLNASRCRQGIIEYNEFNGQKPAIELTEIYSTEQLENFRPAFGHGKLLLYDIHKNKDIIRELYRDLCEDANSSEQCQTLSQLLTGPLVTPSCVSTVGRNVRNEPAHNAAPTNGNRNAPSDPLPPKIQEVKLYPGSNDPTVRTESQSGDNNQPAGENSVTDREGPGGPKTSGLDGTKETDNRGKSHEDDLAKTQSGYVQAFEDLYSSFRQAAADCFAGRSETMIGEAEEKIRIASPDFDIRNLTAGSAPLVLDIIESVVQSAFFYKRPKIRQDALDLISRLYTKQYDLLEQHGTLDEVEQVYFRLNQ